MKDELERRHPSPSRFSDFWLLDPEITFLNHGSFGACPVPVLEAQTRLRERIERQPLQFFSRDMEGLLDSALRELATFVGADPADLAFVPNATTGINTVLKSLKFEPGDELLTTNQEYNACRNALNYVAERFNLQVVIAEVPFPIQSSAAVIEAVIHCVSPRTRLALLDHVVSQTGLVFPIAQLIQAMTQRGIETLIDGAHAPGMVPLNLRELGATYYTGNCHKWLCAPKGAAFLYVHPDRQPAIRPLTISHGANSPRCDRSRFRLEFDWTGTGDPTAYLCVPEAIRFMGSLLAGGWSELMARNRMLVLTARQRLHEALNLPLSCPDNLVGSLATIPLPDGNPQKLQDELLNRYQIEVPIIPYPHSTSRKLRISAQLYNYPEQYIYLSEALIKLLEEEKNGYSL
ncbi:aminotransferase class V-fold PLP-dependent enzyme [Leptothermofonsia sichuanensis E412]|uniref:aminotransferase class V-fold PLP-dependent enzyme n=1 Tax=Leptothermofonsia sichuanensis TaxID=2917832 RepID=UPI001CA65E60|nr:aminotransferase class V-fold PLP-dependent enzyme [Leptothermofonsia sichuanensis]QZZ21297.1 aminotransferase class V-fold PLP-dependent enzyme [Leptothermofonsia sichuanensis E412]